MLRKHAGNFGEMMMRKLFVIGTALLAFGLTGCDLYYGTPNDSDCDLWGCEQEAWPQPGPVQPGGECRSNDQCAAGCYCDNDQAICIETGFCNLESDCPGEFTCDDRATCVPAIDDGGCDREDGCDPLPPPMGPGEDCSADLECLQGCFCREGMCVETGFCDSDADCMDIVYEDGTIEEAECDPARNTCVPRTPPAANCNDTITCAVAAPDCPADRTPAIVDGCYVTEGSMEDQCLLRADCDVTPLATCDRILSENQCQNRPDCLITYDGTDCVCANGDPLCECTDPGAVCECASWEARCESI